ncbi:trypsin delta [Drosophila mauritiana]|uniref:trypsin n=1 Tax=Drosophila mauritiana TaxID=7226 RepID=A0A6P8K135_DROMA|nr:trypsin delta [Drosophila mauritiana]
MFSKCFHLLFAVHLLISPVVPDLLEPSERIIGGSSIDITNVPWQVSLLHYGKQFCGGSIYSQTIIITAAHCVEARDLSIRAGSSLHDSGGVVVAVESFIIHPEYDRSNFENDVAILKLRSPLTFSDSIQTIPLAKTDPPTSSSALATGWGFGYFYTKPRQLQGVDLLIRPRVVCKLKYGSSMFDGDICAGRIGKGGCDGDSGGPLVFNDQLVGITSRKGNLLCLSSSLYASVAYYRNWILSAIDELNFQGAAKNV